MQCESCNTFIDEAEAFHIPLQADRTDRFPMEEPFEGTEPFQEEADSSQVAPDAGTPSPQRLKFSEKGDIENAAETPPAESTPMDPPSTFIQERSASSMAQVIAPLEAQVTATLGAVPHSGPA